jgi:CRP-like cAMP-binding protein
MKHQFAAVHELARIEMLAGLPGEVLGKLAEQMERRTLEPGEEMTSGDDDGRLYVVITGMLSAESRGLLRPGDSIGGSALTGAPVRAVTPAVVASCNRETFDELVRGSTAAP